MQGLGNINVLIMDLFVSEVKKRQVKNGKHTQTIVYSQR
jgi:hypothetical protein